MRHFRYDTKTTNFVLWLAHAAVAAAPRNPDACNDRASSIDQGPPVCTPVPDSAPNAPSPYSLPVCAAQASDYFPSRFLSAALSSSDSASGFFSRRCSFSNPFSARLRDLEAAVFRFPLGNGRPPVLAPAPCPAIPR